MHTNSKALFVRRVVAMTSMGLLVVSLFVPTNVTAQDTPKEPLKPPGRCTGTRHRLLQTIVEKICSQDGLRRCESATDTVQQMKFKEIEWAACALARVAINVECFEGGDDGHKHQAKSAKGASEKCLDLRLAKEAHEQREKEKKEKAAREKADQEEKKRREREAIRRFLVLSTAVGPSDGTRP